QSLMQPVEGERAWIAENTAQARRWRGIERVEEGQRLAEARFTGQALDQRQDPVGEYCGQVAAVALAPEDMPGPRQRTGIMVAARAQQAMWPDLDLGGVVQDPGLAAHAGRVVPTCGARQPPRPETREPARGRLPGHRGATLQDCGAGSPAGAGCAGCSRKPAIRPSPSIAVCDRMTPRSNISGTMTTW